MPSCATPPVCCTTWASWPLSLIHICVLGFDAGDQVDQVLRFARVRVVVGEVAVHFAEQRDDAAAQRFDQLRGDHAGGAVAAVDHHLERLGQGDVVADGLEVARQDVDLLHAADARGQIVVVQAGFQRLDLLVGQGVAGEDVYKRQVHLPTPDRVSRIDVVSARDMLAACETAMPCDVLIAAAAVADYRPEVVAQHKLKKDPSSGEGMLLQMVRNQMCIRDRL